MDLVPSRTLRADMFPSLFQLVEAAHVPWLMAPSSIFKARRAPTALVDSEPPFSLLCLEGLLCLPGAAVGHLRQ